jgi:hypothetical protein
MIFGEEEEKEPRSLEGIYKTAIVPGSVHRVLGWEEKYSQDLEEP